MPAVRGGRARMPAVRGGRARMPAVRGRRAGCSWAGGRWVWPEVDGCALYLAVGGQPTGDLVQRLAGLWMVLVRRQVGQGHRNVRVSEYVGIRDVPVPQVEHLVVEERDIEVDGARGVLVLGVDPFQFLFDDL